MRRLFLVFGDSGAGKSFLADTLEITHHFDRISVDYEYVEFIRARCPALYFEELRSYIGTQYDGILKNRAFSLHQFQRDFVAEWHSHLLDRIRAGIGGCEDLVVEGYLLYDCRHEFEEQLRDSASVFQIHVENRQYTWRSRVLTAAQIAGLGPGSTPDDLPCIPPLIASQ
jgi:hypothetical protein